MASDALETLAALSELPGISGQEGAVRAYLRERAAARADELRTDALGNLFAVKGAGKPGPRILLAAHMDEIGLIVTSVDDDGFVRFRKVGGIDDRVLLAKAVHVGQKRVPGVIGSKPIHLQSPGERTKVVPADEMYIDIGAKDKAEAQRLVEPGDAVTFATSFGEFGEGMVKGKAFDDRAGCTVLLEALAGEYDAPVYGVFTVQEEIGLRGARVAAYAVEPDVALVLEGTPAADIPLEEGETSSTVLGRGPALSFMDGSSIADRELVQTIIRVAEREGIPWQWRRTQGGGNDAGAIHLSKAGVRTASISVPCRYIHTPCAVLHKEDLRNTIRLVQAVVAELASQRRA
ncbi:MAG: M42 family metallopeptidase [Firmicutes bacterium]|nr:M42 family metallopeptidase [Bacillota bacterium]